MFEDASGNSIDVARAPFKEVKAALVAASREGRSVEDDASSESVEVDDTQSGVETEVQAGAGTNGESDSGSRGESGSDTDLRNYVPRADFEREQERFKSISANNHRMSQELRELREQLQRDREARAAAEAEAEKQRAVAVEDYIRTNIPPHLQEQVRREWQASQRIEAANKQAEALTDAEKALQAREQNLAAIEQRLVMEKVRGTVIPNLVSLGDHVAREEGIEPDALRAVLQQEPVQYVLNMAETPEQLQRDLLVVAEVVRAMALSQKGQASRQKQQNRQQAQGGERVQGAAGMGGSQSQAQQIQNMSKADWKRFREKVSRTKNISAALV